jgi:hypothetical protein
MFMFAIFVFLTGSLLGMRFKVLVLIPGIAIIESVLFWAGSRQGESAIALLIPAAIAWGGLELGYFCGSMARYRLQAQRAFKVLKRAEANR